jgi:hypothetical protein
MQNNKFLKISHILLGSCFIIFGSLCLIVLLYAIVVRFFLPSRYSMVDQAPSAIVYVVPEEFSDQESRTGAAVTENGPTPDRAPQVQGTRSIRAPQVQGTRSINWWQLILSRFK